VTDDLNRKLNITRQNSVSQRDVPGIPRSVLTPLAAGGVRLLSVGGNGEVLPPNVPPAFVWQNTGQAYKGSQDRLANDQYHHLAATVASRAGVIATPPSNVQMLMLWHGYGYGKLPSGTANNSPAPDFVQLPVMLVSVRARAQTQIHARARTQTHARARTNTRKHTHTHTQTHKRSVYNLHCAA
jgi:hypothetical protein